MQKAIPLFCAFIFSAFVEIHSQPKEAYITYVGEVELYLYTITWSDGSFYTGGGSNFSRDRNKINQIKRNGVAP